MSNDILVFVELKSSKIRKTSLELLSEANRLAPTLGGKIHALLIGEKVTSSVSELGAYGVSKAFVAEHPDLKDYNAQRFSWIVEEACKKSNCSVLLATSNSTGKDLMPRVAVRLNTGMITECTSLTVQNQKVVGRRPVLAGKCLVEVSMPKASPQIITCRPNVFEVVKGAQNSKPEVVTLDFAVASKPCKAKLLKTIESKAGEVDLTEASIIVSAGRAIKSAENFSMIREMANVLGAGVGASRAAVDAGYASHSIQVGQTGKTVNPKLYIACGISGAIQHLAGMATSKVIVAINTDPDAPIFQKADYGIVGDIFTVVPEMTKTLKNLLKE